MRKGKGKGEIKREVKKVRKKGQTTWGSNTFPLNIKYERNLVKNPPITRDSTFWNPCL